MHRVRNKLIFVSFVTASLVTLFTLSAPIAQATDATVALRWALGALEPENEKPSAIDRDTQLQGGDRLKFLVEPLSEGSIYLLLLDSDDAVHVLYRQTLAPDSADGAGPSYIPSEGQWFRVDEQSGMETFFLLASVTPLVDLEGLLDEYGAAADSVKGDLSRRIVEEIRRQHKAHRNFARPIEKPMMIGGQTRSAGAGTSIDRLAVEVTAENFYAKTITIEH